jgi:hypothetical protein
MTVAFHWKFGRKPRSFDPRVPHFSALRMKLKLRSSLPQAPAAVDYTRALPPTLGMMLNDRLGDCAEAGFFHFVQVWTQNAESKLLTVPDQTVQQLYSDGTGFNPNAAPVDGENPTDEGTDLQSLLTYLLNTGALMPDGTRHKILAFFEVDPSIPGDLDLVTAECGAIYLGFNVPAFLQAFEAPGSVWDVSAGGNNTIVGGHCVISPKYTQRQRGIVSWGSSGYSMTAAFVGQFVDECYAIVDPLFIAATGKTPFGLTEADWSEQMAGIKAAA